MVDVIEWTRANNREASQEDIRLWVREGSQTIIVLLACSVPEIQADKLSTNAQVFRVVVKPVWVCGLYVVSWDADLRWYTQVWKKTCFTAAY